MTTNTGAGAPSPDVSPAPAVPPIDRPIPPDIPPKPGSRRIVWTALLAGVAVVLVAAAAALWVTDPLSAFGDTSRRAVFEKVDPRKAHIARVEKLLEARAKALLAGDEKAWLATVDPGDEKLRADQRRMFRVLRAMEVRRFDHTAGLPSTELTMSATAGIDYCFGTKACRPAEAEAALSLAEHDGELVITDYKARGEIRPWQVSDLRVEVGKRVVVAAQPRHADRLSRLRRQADRIAEYVARFAPRDGTMGKHLIFLGSPGSEAVRWYEGDLKRFDYGRAYDLEASDEQRLASVEHVLRVDKLQGLRLRSILAWHLGYGAASAGTLSDRTTAIGTWGLTIGIAVHMQHRRMNPAGYEIGPDLRLVLKSWKGELADFFPGADGGFEWQTAAWVVVHRLIKRYGEKEFIAFLNAVAREGEPLRTAAPEHLGASLGKVQSDLLRRLRRLS